MATAIMGISGAPNGSSRNDGVPGVLVTVTNVSPGSGSNELVILNKSGAAPPALGGSSPTWTFLPPGGVYGQTYVLRLSVDDGPGVGEDTTTRTFRIPTEHLGLLIPGPNEQAHPAASLQNNGAAIIEASYDNFGGNYLGWDGAGRAWLEYIEELTNQVPLWERSGDPAAMATRGFLYAKTDGGIYFRNSVAAGGTIYLLNGDGETLIATGATTDAAELAIFDQDIFPALTGTGKVHDLEISVKATKPAVTYKSYRARHTGHVHEDAAPTFAYVDGALEFTQYPVPTGETQELQSRVDISASNLRVHCKSMDASEGTVNWRVEVKRKSYEI